MAYLLNHQFQPHPKFHQRDACEFKFDDDSGIQQCGMNRAQHMQILFRKKPAVISAARWEPDEHGVNRLPWPLGWGMPNWKITEREPEVWDLIIPTLNGEVRVTAGEWVIQGVEGEFYPCADSIFKATYEPA